jgi:hypothetical protein
LNHSNLLFHDFPRQFAARGAHRAFLPQKKPLP